MNRTKLAAIAAGVMVAAVASGLWAQTPQRPGEMAPPQMGPMMQPGQGMGGMMQPGRGMGGMMGGQDSSGMGLMMRMMGAMAQTLEQNPAMRQMAEQCTLGMEQMARPPEPQKSPEKPESR